MKTFDQEQEARSPGFADEEIVRLLCAVLSENAELRTKAINRCRDPELLMAVINLANDESMLSSLHPVLESSLPDAPKYHRAVIAIQHQANRQRNHMLKEAIHEIAVAAASRGIPIMALKGAAWLLQDGENLAAWREMIDVDLLVAADRLNDMPRLLTELGYQPEERRRRLFGTRGFRNHFHLIPFRRPAATYSIEVHHHLGWEVDLLPPGVMFENERKLAGNLSVPAPWCAALHAIVHWQIQHDAFQRGSATVGDIKCAYDLARFLRQDEIDWNRLAAHADELAIRKQFEAALTISTGLFHVKAPSGMTHAATGDPIERFFEVRASPWKRWIERRRARISSLWKCERAMYPVRLRTKDPILLGLAMGWMRTIRLPVTAFMLAGLGMELVRRKCGAASPGLVGRP